MKAFLLRTGKRIAPFGDPVGQCLVVNKTIDAWREDAARACGLELVEIDDLGQVEGDECFLFFDDLFLSPRAMRSFVKRSRKAGTPGALGLPRSTLSEAIRPLQGLRTWGPGAGASGESAPEGGGYAYDAYYLRGGLPPSEAMLAELPVCEIRYREKVIRKRLPEKMMGMPHIDLPLSSYLAMRIVSWVHLLWANNYGISVRWIEEVLGNAPWAAGTALKALSSTLLRGEVTADRVLRRMVRKGRNTRIHPTAIVESSILGDDVEVGPYAAVRGCVIGDRVVIEDRASLDASVIGDDCYITKQCTLAAAAAYPGGSIGCRMSQLCLIGREAVLTFGLGAVDMSVRGNVKVMHEGRLEDAGTSLLGVCYGHRFYGGADVRINAGRAMPNDTMLISSMDHVASKIPDDLPSGVPLVVRKGVVVPYGQPSRKREDDGSSPVGAG